MKFISLKKLKAQGSDERAFQALHPILSNPDVLEYIQEHQKIGTLKIPHQEMKKRFGIDYSILFIYDEEQHCHPVVVSAGTEKGARLPKTIHGKINGGGRTNSIKKLAFGLEDGKTWFLKRINQDRAGIAEFRDEYETLVKLGRCGGKTTIDEKGKSYFITDLLKGEDLEKYKDLLENKTQKHRDPKKLTQSFYELALLFKAAAESLNAFHSLGLIHRDIKLANFMRVQRTDNRYGCMLIDFGSSNTKKEICSRYFGTQVYFAPELNEQEFIEFTQDTDLFAFGKSFQELFGIFSDHIIFKTRILPRNARLKFVFQEVQTILNGLMHAETKRRYEYFSRISDLTIPPDFKTKFEAYTYVIYKLYTLKKHYEMDNDTLSALSDAIDLIKIQIENHQFEFRNITTLLEVLLLKNLNNTHKVEIENLIFDINNSSYLPAEDNASYDDELLPRRFESELTQQLLLNPTEKMMESTEKISNAIITIIQDILKNGSTEENKQLSHFLDRLTKGEATLGGMLLPPNIEEVIRILKEGEKKDYIVIQHIIYKFSEFALRFFPVKNTPQDMQMTGELFQVLQDIEPSLTPSTALAFFRSHVIQRDAVLDRQGEGYRFRAHIMEKTFLESRLFKLEDGKRGRDGTFDESICINMLGLMKLTGDTRHCHNMHMLPFQSWVHDSLAQKINRSSLFYQRAKQAESFYISGPSGMTALLFNQMEMLGVMKTVEEKQSYILSVLAYIVGGGFHSMHEILGPIASCLGLLPNYEVPELTEEGSITSPNFHLFFEIMDKVDEDFSKLRSIAWDAYLTYFKETYMPLCMPHQCEESAVYNVKKRPNLEVTLIQKVISAAISSYKQKSEEGKNECFTPIETKAVKQLNKLSELCQSASSLFEILIHLKHYFAGSLFKNTHSIASKFSSHSFLAHFLNELKNEPTLITIINHRMDNKDFIRLDRKLNYTTSEAATERLNLHRNFKTMHIELSNTKEVKQETLPEPPRVIILGN